MLFFPAKTACHDTPHNKFNMCIERVKIIPIIRIKFNKILIIIYKVNVFCLVKYLGITSMAIKKSLHLARSFVNIILHFYKYNTLSFCEVRTYG